MTASDKRLFEALLRLKLAAFTERCFNELMPAHTYLHNWHLEAIAYHLEQVADGRIKRLIITLPPRSLKSLITSVAFPAWVLGQDAHKRIISVSYARTLVADYANQFRRVARADWYRALYPWMRIDPRKDTEDEVRTTAGGYRLTATVGGALTGRGGSIVIIDDPMKAADAQSEAERTKVNRWFDETLLSRLDDKRNDAIVIVMQRLHVDDLVGHVKQTGEWVHLDLPAIADEAVAIPIGPGRIHRRHPGELLHPEREPLSVLEDQRASMGSAAFSAQYQQQPVPPGGDMVKWSWFGRWAEPLPKKSYATKIVQSWDTASKSNQLADFSVGITARVEKDAIYILDVVRERLDYPALKKRIVREKERWKADIVLIEDKGSGQSLIQDLRHDHVFAKAVLPEGDKVVRMSACTAKIEAGAVLLPTSAPWLDGFRTELMAFPNGKHDDQADALSQLINWTRTKSTYTLDFVG